MRNVISIYKVGVANREIRVRHAHYTCRRLDRVLHNRSRARASEIARDNTHTQRETRGHEHNSAQLEDMTSPQRHDFGKYTTRER